MVDTKEFKQLEKEANKIHLSNSDLLSYEDLNTFVYVLERIETQRGLL